MDSNQTPSDQPVQQPPAVLTPPQTQTHISVGNIEEGAASIVQESPDSDANEDDEDELKVAPQETKNQAVGQGGIADLQEEVVEMHPSGSEIEVTASPEVESVIERTADQEKPTISKELHDAGVTHSGLGVIPVDDNTFGVSQMPAITIQQAVEEEKKTEFKASKHWLMGMIVYIWRKLQTKEV